MKKTDPLGDPPKYEKPAQSCWASDYVVFAPLGLAASTWISVLGMFLIGVMSAFLVWQFPK